MSDNPLARINLPVMKSGKMYWITFPTEPEQLPSGAVFQFQVSQGGVSAQTTKEVHFSNRLSYEQPPMDWFRINVVAVRAVFSLLGEQKMDYNIRTDNFGKLLAGRGDDLSDAQYALASYITERNELLFEPPYRIIEFVTAINYSAETVVRAAKYFDKLSWINLDISPDALDRLDFKDSLPIESKLNFDKLNAIRSFAIDGRRQQSRESARPLIFMSYRTKDKHLVGQIKAKLEVHAYDVFLAHEDIEPSEEWVDVILENLDACDVFIPVLTENFRDSEWTDQEVGHALAKDKLIIPLMFEESPHGFLGKKQGLKCSSDDIDASYAKIVELVKAKTGVT